MLRARQARSEVGEQMGLARGGGTRQEHGQAKRDVQKHALDRVQRTGCAYKRIRAVVRAWRRIDDHVAQQAEARRHGLERDGRVGRRQRAGLACAPYSIDALLFVHRHRAHVHVGE